MDEDIKPVSAGDALVEQLNAALGEGEEWDEREAAVLDLARRQADDIERLELLLETEGATVMGAAGQTRMNPAFGELRQQRLALTKILASVRLPEEGMGQQKDVVKQRAANYRWDRVRQQKEAAGGAA